MKKKLTAKIEKQMTKQSEKNLQGTANIADDRVLGTAPLYLIIDSRGGTLCAKNKTNDLNKVDEDWERFVLLASKSKKEICHHANISDYGANCVVANEHGLIFWEWYNEDGRWRCA